MNENFEETVLMLLEEILAELKAIRKGEYEDD